jgi:hypothetical protein
MGGAVSSENFQLASRKLGKYWDMKDECARAPGSCDYNRLRNYRAEIIKLLQNPNEINRNLANLSPNERAALIGQAQAIASDNYAAPPNMYPPQTETSPTFSRGASPSQRRMKKSPSRKLTNSRSRSRSPTRKSSPPRARDSRGRFI